MTRDDILELGDRRSRRARRRWTPIIGVLALAVAVVLALAVFSPKGGTMLSLSLLLMLGGWTVLGLVRLAESRTPSRYVDGPLVVNAERRLLYGSLLAYGGSGAGFVLSGIHQLGYLKDGDFLSPALFAPIAAVAAFYSLRSAGWAALRLARPAPLLVVSDKGIFSPAAMRRPIPWDEVKSLPIAPTSQTTLLALDAPAVAVKQRSFGDEGDRRTFTHLISGAAADASQADVLLAIASYRPDLVEALDLPDASGAGNRYAAALASAPPRR